MDEMRYGLMLNYRRSWSRIGKRTEWKNQQEFANGYLYSAIAPVSGESFHLIGFKDANSSNTKIFLKKLKEAYPTKHIVVILDNAPFHRLKIFQWMERLTLIFLPPYSPQLNPTERFFEELRKTTANRIFDTLEEHEKKIEGKIIEYGNDARAVRRLAGYDWILKQYERVF